MYHPPDHKFPPYQSYEPFRRDDASRRSCGFCGNAVAPLGRLSRARWQPV